MKAAVLHNFGVPLSLEQVTDPVIGTGEVLVDVVAAPVLSYTGEVLSGARRYLLPTPVVPGAGAIGRVRAVGPDATRLQPGDWVFCDPTVRSRDGAPTPDITLQGARAPEARAGRSSSATSATARLPSRSACQRRMPHPSAQSTLRKLDGGARSARY